MSVDQETIIRLRKVMVEILDEFVRICEENNLTYFLAAGTLLGAVRHKGFIPWDDDIDIAMPRNDYEKLLDLFQDDITSNYYTLSYRCPVNTYWHYRDFAKLCKKGTVYAESNIDNPGEYAGIFIDIWPFDNCVPFFLPIQTKLIAFSRELYSQKTSKNIPQNKMKRFLKKLLWRLVSLQFSRTLLKESYSFFNRFTTQYISFFPGIYGYKKETHKYSTLFPLTTVCFEGKNYQAPGKWDIFLSELYGNYMELPPVEQRVSHNIKFISFDDKDNNEK